MLSYFSFRQLVHGPQDTRLFITSDGKLVSKTLLTQNIKQLVEKIGLDPKYYASHYLRSGVITTAAILGFQDWEVNFIREWVSGPSYQHYIKDKELYVAAFRKKVGLDNQLVFSVMDYSKGD